MLIPRWLAGLAPALLAWGCAATPIAVAPHVDLERFMGDWYVIANIPTFIEKDAYNAVESYRLDADGTIATTFTFRAGGFDGEVKRYTPRGFVREGTNNAVWGMQFVWPIKADYRILYLADDYSLTLIGRAKRDHLWVMARTPSIPVERLEAVLSIAAAQGYDVNRVQKVPQRWN
ncbi:MAG TPA: lipocalin family protein [Burkholderiales bacterium]|nr:lipocalin family protein [Burkholderiales bacterium]